MANDFYSESLVHYALRNPITLKYKSKLGTPGTLVEAQLFSSLIEAERWAHDEYTQIRRIKVVDLGDFKDA